jgi:putative RecB family exonuclease
MQISYSNIKAYLFCPWKYKLIYEDRWHVPPNPSISLGHSIHRALEDYYSNKKEALDELLESYDRHWVNEGFSSARQSLESYRKGEDLLKGYWHSNKDSKSRVFAVEKEFNIFLGRHYLIGTIDRIDRLPDGTYEIIDYKTHAELWDKERIDNDLQLSVYSIACERLMYTPMILSYYFLAHAQKISTQRSSGQIKDTMSLISDVAGKISSGSYAPDTQKCKACDFKRKCVYSKERSSEEN